MTDICAWCGKEQAVALTRKGPVCNSCSYRRQFEEEPKKWPDDFRGFGSNVQPKKIRPD